MLDVSASCRDKRAGGPFVLIWSDPSESNVSYYSENWGINNLKLLCKISKEFLCLFAWSGFLMHQSCTVQDCVEFSVLLFSAVVQPITSDLFSSFFLLNTFVITDVARLLLERLGGVALTTASASVF